MKVKNNSKKIRRTILLTSFILAIVFILLSFADTFTEKTTSSIWDGSVASSFSNGTGIESDPYIISNGSELAYFFDVINGDLSANYFNKYYIINNNINLDNKDFSQINTLRTFSGHINGNGYTISNFTINNDEYSDSDNVYKSALFNKLESATIENINFTNVTMNQNSTDNDSRLSLIADTISNSNILNISINNLQINTLETEFETSVSAIANIDDGDNNIENVNIDLNTNDIDAKLVFNQYNDSTIGLIISKSNNLEVTDNSELEITNYRYLILDDNILFENDGDVDSILNLLNTNSSLEWTLSNGIIRLKNNGTNPRRVLMLSAPTPRINAHDSGVDGTTVYVNDLTADFNYYEGENYIGVWDNNIPDGENTHYFDEDKLIEVQITYDGHDIDNSSIYGEVSPLNGENANTFVYYKYYPYARDMYGNLLTDSNGNNYIHIELIDNPFGKRPIVDGAEYGFNGWVCNQTSGSTYNICSVSKLVYDDAYYTRYLDVPVTAGNPLIINLNASWVVADVKVSTNNDSPNDFNDKGMQSTTYQKTITETLNGTYYTWKNNYYTFTYSRTITNRGYTSAGEWYYETTGSEPAPNGDFTLVYSRNNYGHRCARNSTCYVYTATSNGVTSGSIYAPGDVYAVTASYPSNPDTGTVVSVRFLDQYYSRLMNTNNGTYQLTHQVEVSMLLDHTTASGYYYQVNNPTTEMLNTKTYYTSAGVLCTNRSNCTTAYKLIQYEDSTDKSNGSSIYNVDVNGTYTIVDQNKYYYLVTRDTNIFKLNGTVNGTAYTSTKPYTLTGYNGNSITGIINVSSGGTRPTYYNLTASDDLRIENVKFSGMSNNGGSNLGVGDASFSQAVIYANSNNLKIGRNITNSTNSNYIVANSVVGGSSNAISGSFKVIVETGHYNGYTSGSGSSNGGTLNEITVFGSDYDRVKNENTKLWFNLGLEGYSHSNHSPGSGSLFVSMNYIKSGTFGYNGNGTASSDNNAGLYITARAGNYIGGITGAKIEGGRINNAVGGYGFSGSSANNSTHITMTGGNVRIIYGGAGTSATYGNRIIGVTGGTVEYSVLGGSNSYAGSSTDGKLTSDTLVYIGGNATIGNADHIRENSTLYNVESGSVFGAGGGRSGDNYTGLGTVNNSHVIINGGTILGSVYGGGNYGSTGTQLSATSKTTIDIYDGTINNVFGGSKSSGFGKNDYKNGNKITINTQGGTIGNIYGGSDATGTCYGSTELNIDAGTITGNIYGGGRGSETYVTNNVDVNIGSADPESTSDGPTISGNVYGGSAYGTVNANAKNAAANNMYVNVTVNKGTVTGAVFGGAQGSRTDNYIPYVKGNITVTINDGTIGEVYGGFDDNGSPQGNDVVYLKGGTIGNAFGGGNNTSITTTNIYLQGSNVTNLYGGSNNSGTVTTTNVHVESGTADSVYGGNNAGGTCSNTNVDMSGGNVTTALYGGGNLVNTGTTLVNITNTGNTIPSVFGGGNNATCSTTNVNARGGNITNLYGGGNLASVTTTNVNLYGGTITSVYGGGNEAGATTTRITGVANYTPTATNVYGGSNQSGDITTTNVVLNSGTYTNVYGGNNAGGVSSTTNVTIKNGTITNVYGGGDNANVGTTNVSVSYGTITNLYGGGNNAQVNTNTNVNITGGTITSNLYGGGNNGVTAGNTYVKIEDGNINGSAYAGGNGVLATVNGNTNIEVGGTTVIGTASCACAGGQTSCAMLNTCSVFGGGNAAYTGTSTSNNSKSTVNIVGATIYGNVYGGANTSVVYGAAEVNIGDAATVSNTITKDDISIKGTVFGGGEANASGSEIFDYYFISVTNSIVVNIDGTSYTTNDLSVLGSIFGSGNASSSGGTSEINIYNYGSHLNPKKTTSIQRTDVLTVDNSALIFTGATDRTNEYSDVLFDLSLVDELKLKNNSTLYFRNGANKLGAFKSLDSNDNYAVVTIDDELETVTKSVDNRIYVYEGEVLNIANERLTVFNNVYGMTFFGMFKGFGATLTTGMYGDYDYGDSLTGSGIFVKGSYVMGAHKANHDITVDGFYSNFEDTETGNNIVKYIEPTPPDTNFYKWIIGEVLQEYNVDLVASKYSTLGAIEVPFGDFTAPNTSFEIINVDYSGLIDGFQLVNKNDIPKRAASSIDADTIMGLSMEPSNTGWLTSGMTNFYNSPTPIIAGVTKYDGDSTNSVPSLLFYLYHSKNLGTTGDMGTVQVVIEVMTRVHDLKSEPARIVLNLNLSRILYTTNDYEAALTPGRKYELFASTATNITSRSSISAYYSLYADETNLYQHGNYRALTSNIIFPENTKITMIDLSDEDNIEYYYHVMTASDVATATANYSGEVSYNLSMFELMGSFNSDVYYSDSVANNKYYHSTDDYSQEEFIFIIDFEDAVFDSNLYVDDVISNCMILIELVDPVSLSNTISVMGNEVSYMTYNIYSNSDATISIDGTINSDTIYPGDVVGINLDIGYSQAQESGYTVYDTKLFDEKIGLKLSLYDAHDNIISGVSLMGLNYNINGSMSTSPSIDGTARIKVADRVGNVNVWINMDTGTANISSGEYTLKIESFSSSDGIYYGLNTSDSVSFDVTFVTETYGLNVEIEPEGMIIDKTTGFNLGGTNESVFNITYDSHLSSPSIRTRMFRRIYDDVNYTIWDGQKEEVDLLDYITNTLTLTANENEYTLISSIQANIDVARPYTFYFKNDLIPGTYVIEFMLYDNNSMIGSVEKYVIIK